MFYFEGEKPKAGQSLPSDRTKFIRFATITRVDEENGLLDLSFVGSDSGDSFYIQMPSAFGSPRASVKGMPEEGSIVVVGWAKQTNTMEIPVILGFIDVNLPNSIDYRLTHGKALSRTTSVDTMQDRIGWDIKRLKRRKIYAGEIQAESTQGAEMYLDDSVYLSNSKLNEIEISAADQSIRMSSLQHYQDTQAMRLYNGMIVREPNQGTNLFQPTILPNGKKIQIVTATNNPFHLGGEALTEYRFEVREKATGRLNITEVNSGWDVTASSPFLTFVAGTVVGNDKNQPTFYGKVLRPQVFGSPDDTKAVVSEIECLPEEYSSLASCYQIKTTSGTKFDIDKQGHMFLNVAASTGQHPLGGGRSLEAAFGGSIKMVVGADVQRTNSIYLDTAGGIKQTLGYSSETFRSIDTVAQKGICTNILGADNNGYSYSLTAAKNVLMDVQGNFNINVAGSYTITVAGKLTEEVLGVKEQLFVNDMNNIYGGSYKEVVIKDKQEKIGGSRDTLISGAASLPPATPVTFADKFKIMIGGRQELYLAGSLERTLTLGNMKATLTAGNIEETIVLGSNKTLVTTGDIKEDVITGNIKNTVGVGNIKETITTGKKTTTITAGNIESTILTGSIKQTITTGDSSDDIKAGNKKVTIKAGNYKVDVTAGNVSIKTKAGKIDINSLAGGVTVSGMAGVALKSGAKIEAMAPMVKLGMVPIGGVITQLTHLDYLTGLPLIPSITVKASS